MVFEMKDYDDFKAAVERFCAFLCERKISPEVVFDCKLVAHELVGNVFQHAGGGARLCVEIENGCIQIAVRAEKGFCPPKESVCPDVMAERGRGLYLVDKASVERIFTEEGDILVRIKIG